MINNQWYAILPSKAVKRSRILAVKRLNMDLALFRESNGTLGCVIDQCTHRGAALSKGKIKSNCVECPFHGLQFSSTGQCKFIPANGKASLEDLSRYNVLSMPVKESNGIIYLWYGDIANMTEDVPVFENDINDAMAYSEFSDLWNSHYSRCIENQLDVVHLPFVHHNTIGRGNKTLVNGPKVELINGGLITSANNELDNGQKPKKSADCIIKSTYLKFLYPNIWMNHISDKIKVVIYFAPIDDENTMLYIRFYDNITGVKVIDRLIAALGKPANFIVERQDKRVVITQRPKASSFKSNEKLLSGDSPIIQYRKKRDELKEHQ